MRIVFSGGGTGGHIFPSIAVAEEILKRVPLAEILFVGAKGKMEMTRVPKAGFRIKGLWISGFQRRLTWKNILFPIKLFISLIQAYSLIKKFKPDIVAGFGGFASGPALFIASKTGIPTLIQEQNSYPGITNKLLGKRVDKVCVAYEEVRKFFPEEKVVLTGNPVRHELLKPSDKEKAAAHFGLRVDKKIALIIGGSLGANRLNAAMRSSSDKIGREKNIQILWQCGGAYYDQYRNSDTAKLDQVHLLDFIEKMKLAYDASDLVVCRSGALTISEICVLGKPAILVPSPNVAEDHQTKNARTLSQRRAALLIRDDEVEEKLVPEILRVLKDEILLQELGANCKKLGMPHATKCIVDEIISLIG